MRKHMKKFLCLCTASGLLLAAPAGEAGANVLTDMLTVRAEAAAAKKTASVKSGLKKEQGKYVYYVKGKKVKNTWKTVGKFRYYFGKNGAALQGLQKIKGTYYFFDSKCRMKKGGWQKVGNTKCYLDKTGKALTGVRIINEKFYWLGKNARRDAKKTRQLQAAAAYEKDFSALKKLIGNPVSAEYMGSCYGAGEDGILTYQSFTVYTYREDGKEQFMGAEAAR